MTQSDTILNYLEQHESISPVEALTVAGCFRLAARINDLRNRGHKIETKIKQDINGRRYARYQLVSKA
jgi:hypothetical protein